MSDDGDAIVEVGTVGMSGDKDVTAEENKTNVGNPRTSQFRRYDSLDIESRKFSGSKHDSEGAPWSVVLLLAFQSIGIVYGDLGTSPMYVYAGTFQNGIKHNDDILGVLSLIFYTLTLIPLVKYVFIVLRANDNGEGGTFALYSLICRCANVGLTPNQQVEDQEVSNFQLELQSSRLKRASKIKTLLENSRFAKYLLFFATILGTSMVIGDGILTPSITVLSAVGGIKEASDKMTNGMTVWISVAVLIILFMVQRFGTEKVGYSFAPILCIWFAFIGGIGVYNFIKYDPGVVKALNPLQIVSYFVRNKKEAWISLGGVILCTTGSEALFADVGHFTVRSIQISTCAVTYPAVVLAYFGQASFLRKHNDLVANVFYKSIPGPVYWPMFVLAVMAAVIGSQSLISGTFSIIHQSLALGCFPRVKVVHTSPKYKGQVYIPEFNFILMLACVAVSLGFQSTVKIGNAYGVAVVFVMTLTSALLVLVMIMIWKTHILLIISYIVTIGFVELFYLSSVLYKFNQGGYIAIVFAGALMAIMYVWHDVYRRKYFYELQNKVSSDKLMVIASETNICRLPGLAMFYSELVQGIPPIFKHYVENVPALHSVLVFVTVKSLPISVVSSEERFLFRRIKPEELNVFRCVVRYGYNDMRVEPEAFERMLIERLKEFISEDIKISQMTLAQDSRSGAPLEDEGEKQLHVEEVVGREMETIDRAWRAGVVHLIGENEVVAGNGAGLAKRALINYAYNFLKRNVRQNEQVFGIPHKRMLKVGMTYEL